MIGIFEVSFGGMSGTLADPKLIFATALKCCASGIILAHNHTSGNLRASNADIALTRKLKTASSFLDIKLHNHLIVTSEGYLSLEDDGII